MVHVKKNKVHSVKVRFWSKIHRELHVSLLKGLGWGMGGRVRGFTERRWREKVGQSGERVKHSDGRLYKTVSRSVGPGPKTTQSVPWGEQVEKALWRVGRITYNAEGFAGETDAVYILKGQCKLWGLGLWLSWVSWENTNTVEPSG